MYKRQGLKTTFDLSDMTDSRATKAAKHSMVQAYAIGGTIAEACRAMGVNPACHDRFMLDDLEYRRQIDETTRRLVLDKAVQEGVNGGNEKVLLALIKMLSDQPVSDRQGSAEPDEPLTVKVV